MLIEESHQDVPTQHGGDMRKFLPQYKQWNWIMAIVARLKLSFKTAGVYIFHPTIPGYPKAKFPGVVVFSEIYQGKDDCLRNEQGEDILDKRNIFLWHNIQS
jgi:carboxymethylenebutenolidase